jgi:hypothetical protein
MSDIVLDATEQVAILCDNLKVQGHDFLLDSPSRRQAPKPVGFRRALVHDQNDGLTINFAKDYPGGVTISGVRSLEFEIRHDDEHFAKGLGHPANEVLMLADVIVSLRKRIDDLQSQITKLASKA